MNHFMYDAPIEPDDFLGRKKAVQMITDRLNVPGFLSTSVVGGPSTGKTSLLRFLASPPADNWLPHITPDRRVYLDAQGLAATANPFDFWISLFRAMGSQCAALKEALKLPLDKAGESKLTLYHLEDLFDECGRTNMRIVALVDNWDYLLRNSNFWPPPLANNFLHLVRYFGQRIPRGLAFVVSSPRPLLDLWDPGRNASPYYNIFVSVEIPILTDDDVTEFVRSIFQRDQLVPGKHIEDLVREASFGHPYLVSYATWLCLRRAQAGSDTQPADVNAAYRDSSGPLVPLVQRIRDALAPSERELMDLARSSQKNLTAFQKDRLGNLAKYGLLSPGIEF